MNDSAVPRSTTWTRTALIVATCALVAFSLPLTARQAADPFASMVFREIGPTAQGNRFVEVAVVESNPRIFYAAMATGGLFKTENHGIHFVSVFDSPTVSSLGAVAVSQSNPNVLYLGSGEGNNSRSSYWGDGVYVSTDAGRTWTKSGLTDSHHIGRILVHPTDANTAYVAALGRLYSDNEERGLYKTTDGGKTWTKSLGVKAEGKDVGVVDVAMDPKNPLVLYAATYDKVRRPWSFAEAGPGSGVHKTIDGGKTWTKLAGGLPTGILGRIGLSIYRQDPNTVYAIVENAGALNDDQKKRFAAGLGTPNGSPPELYRSDDAGKTWRQVAPNFTPPPAPAGARGAAAPAAAAGTTGAAGAGAGPAAAAGRGRGGYNGGNPPYYYAQVRVDPNDKDHVYLLSDGSSRTRDSGRTWSSAGMGGDSHSLWIDPKDSLHMINGYDHGIRMTFDGGVRWLEPDNIPGAQFYAIGIDMAVPYNVYGGLQDNGSHKGPSTIPGGGTIPFEAWVTVGGGDGMYNEVDWRESRYLYNESQFGVIQRTDMVTGQSAGIQYRRTAVQGQPAPDALRWNWCAPILVSPHNPDVIYHAAQVLLRSPFRGDSWEEISPDLTVNDLTKRAISGPCSVCGGGNVPFATITTIDESPIVAGLLWVGTDDGNVQVSRNGGRTWTNVRDKIPGHPGYWVTRVEASHANAGTAYVTISGLRNDDFRAFIWKTTDFGESWTSIAGNLPAEAINVVREDPRNANLLFAGTDLSVYGTLNGGTTWTRLRGSPAPAGGGGGRGGGGGGGGFGAGGAAAQPPTRGLFATMPVHDMKIHPRDRELVVGTHARGIFIADISAYEDLTPAVLASDASLLSIVPYIQWVNLPRGAMASNNFAGMSRPNDIAISYYLKAVATGDVKIRIYDGSRTIAEMDGGKNAGLNTVRWNLQGRRDSIVGEAPQGGGRGGRGGGRAGGAGAGADPAAQTATVPVVTTVSPGDYRVVLSVGGKDYERTAIVVRDPRSR